MSEQQKKMTYIELGIILGMAVVVALMVLPIYRLLQQDGAAVSCQNNLKTISAAMRMFSEEHGGRFPGRYIDYKKVYHPTLGFWSEPDYLELNPEYMADLAAFFCPSDPLPPPNGWNDPLRGYSYPATEGYKRGIDPSWANYPLESAAKGIAKKMGESGVSQVLADSWCRDNSPDNDQYCLWHLMDSNYAYWDWVVVGSQVKTVADMREMGAVVDNDEEFHSEMNPGCAVSKRFQDFDIVLPDAGKTTLHYLRKGVERFVVTDQNNAALAQQAAADIAILWDKAVEQNRSMEDASRKPRHWGHKNGGISILFLDGHVEYQPPNQPNGGRLWMLSDAAVQADLYWWP